MYDDGGRKCPRLLLVGISPAGPIQREPRGRPEWKGPKGGNAWHGSGEGRIILFFILSTGFTGCFLVALRHTTSQNVLAGQRRKEDSPLRRHMGNR